MTLSGLPYPLIIAFCAGIVVMSARLARTTRYMIAALLFAVAVALHYMGPLHPVAMLVGAVLALVAVAFIAKFFRQAK